MKKPDLWGISDESLRISLVDLFGKPKDVEKLNTVLALIATDLTRVLIACLAAADKKKIRTDWGDISWVNIQDAVDNPLGETGFFLIRLQGRKQQRRTHGRKRLGVPGRIESEAEAGAGRRRADETSSSPVQ